MKVSNNKTLFKSIVVGILCGVLLVGCGQKLSSDFDETDIEKATLEVIQLLNQNDTAKIRDLCTVQLNNALSDEVFAQVYGIIAEGGSFEEIKEMSIAGTKDNESGEEYAMVVANAQYEIKMFTFTFSFTKQMKLAGLFIK